MPKKKKWNILTWQTLWQMNAAIQKGLHNSKYIKFQNWQNMAYALEAYPWFVTWPWVLSKLSPHTPVRQQWLPSFLKWLCWTQTWATQNLHQVKASCSALSKEQGSGAASFQLLFPLWPPSAAQYLSPEFTPWPGQLTYGDWIRKICEGGYISSNVGYWWANICCSAPHQVV